MQHGTRGAPVRLTAHGDEPSIVTVSVANQGPAIAPDRIGGLFNAMKGSPDDDDRRHALDALRCTHYLSWSDTRA
jgi:hypothetical protein